MWHFPPLPVVCARWRLNLQVRVHSTYAACACSGDVSDQSPLVQYKQPLSINGMWQLRSNEMTVGCHVCVYVSIMFHHLQSQIKCSVCRQSQQSHMPQNNSPIRCTYIDSSSKGQNSSFLYFPVTVFEIPLGTWCRGNKQIHRSWIHSYLLTCCARRTRGTRSWWVWIKQTSLFVWTFVHEQSNQKSKCCFVFIMLNSEALKWRLFIKWWLHLCLQALIIEQTIPTTLFSELIVVHVILSYSSHKTTLIHPTDV